MRFEDFSEKERALIYMSLKTQLSQYADFIEMHQGYPGKVDTRTATIVLETAQKCEVIDNLCKEIIKINSKGG